MRTIFTHIEKTGGTTLLRAAINAYGAGRMYHLRPGGWWRLRNGKTKATRDLENAEVIFGHQGYGWPRLFNWPGKNEEFRWVTVLRHPISRLISEYHKLGHQVLNDRGKPTFFNVALHYPDIRDFARWPHVRNLQTRYLSGGAEDAQLALNNLQHYYAAWTTTGGLDDNFNRLLPEVTRLGERMHVNKERPQAWTYSQEVRDDLAESNEEDMELYNGAIELLCESA